MNIIESGSTHGNPTNLPDGALFLRNTSEKTEKREFSSERIFLPIEAKKSTNPSHVLFSHVNGRSTETQKVERNHFSDLWNYAHGFAAISKGVSGMDLKNYEISFHPFIKSFLDAY